MALQSKYPSKIRKLITAGWEIWQKQNRARKRYLEYDVQMSALIAELNSLEVDIPPSWKKR